MSQKPKKDNQLEGIVQKIIALRDDEKRLLIDKYSTEWLLSEFEGDKLLLLEKKFKEFGKKGVDIVNFVTLFLQMITHHDYETLYITMGLVDFFKEIAENMSAATFVKYSDVTTLLADVRRKQPLNRISVLDAH